MRRRINLLRWPLLLLALASAADENSAVAAVEALLARLDPAAANSTLEQFNFAIIESSRCSGKTKLCFGYSSTPAGVLFEGTTGVELSMALNMYLKTETNSSVSWPQTGGNHINIPSPIPPS